MEIDFEKMTDEALRGFTIACVQQVQQRTRHLPGWLDHPLNDVLRPYVESGARAGFEVGAEYRDTGTLPANFASDLGRAIAEGLATVENPPQHVSFERDRQGRLVGAEID